MPDPSQDSVLNGVKKLYPQIAQLQLARDAQQPQNGQFIQALMQMCQQFVGQAMSQAAQIPGGPPGAGSPQPGGPPPGAMGGPGMGSPGAPPQAVSAQPGAMDEIRRMLSATTSP